MDLNTLVRKRIQGEMLMPLLKQGEYKVLVVDVQAFQIVNTVFASMDELHDLNIPRVLEIAHSGNSSAQGNMEAIYFMSPCKSNIQRVISDLSASPPRYSGIVTRLVLIIPPFIPAGAHIFTLRRMCDDCRLLTR